ncbi:MULTISPECIES: nuclear transport factor 2 family protein [Pseudonocardia]|uniref:SnoaL-like domain protein n=2 Tax=Pseudonocardia TaxID=1847 RepID=A0A1Y2N2T6_PSEAH|nr:MULTISPECIES: nuclear transport factor 2 family protein [Pseudonocardia]OSY41774.1 SnoaL-like domain protein [Pseudonocardia autotrophica]TDN71174.1 SnoaL-like protein [Pseudonocardia autotrophica]BBG01844.1 membrane protein [Pseudonocardia autotrophica]GEC23010.1 membrane protein [Pseudonocardia saturnea]
MSSSTADRFRAAIEAGDPDAAVALCTDDVVFRSPVVHRAHRGREPLRAILGAVLTVFAEFRYVAEFAGDGGHVLEFTALVGDREVQGIDLLRIDADGRIRELTVMVRPLSAAEALRDRMAALLGG